MSKAPTTAEIKDAVTEVCEEIRQMLHAKNEAYGNSVPDPLCVFSRSDAIERIHVRLDDKLSRLSRGFAAGEDTEMDIVGYLILKRAISKVKAKGEKE
jgi:hypothetical protein